MRLALKIDRFPGFPLYRLGSVHLHTEGNSTTKGPSKRNRKFNLATHPHACSRKFFAQTAPAGIIPTILMTTATTQVTLTRTSRGPTDGRCCFTGC